MKKALGVNATGMAVLAAMLVLLLLALPTRHHQREADHYVEPRWLLPVLQEYKSDFAKCHNALKFRRFAHIWMIL